MTVSSQKLKGGFGVISLRKLLLILIVCLFTTGCSLLQKESSQQVEEPPPQVEESVSQEEILQTEQETELSKKKVKIKPCSVGKKHSLTIKGKKVGWFRINQIEKVRFADFTNQQAVANSVNYCYSFNVSFRFKKKRLLEKFTVEPVFKQHGEKVSSLANVGWTGFNNEINFYNGEVFDTIEVVMQPVQRGQGSVILKFSDKNNRKYDSVRLKKNELKKAKVGPKLRTAKEEVKVKSVSGAIYSVWPQVINFEKHYYEHSYNWDYFYDIDYKITAWKAPRGSRTVGNISGNGKGAKLACSFKIGVQTANSNKILYNPTRKVVRSKYESGAHPEKYVSTAPLLDFGKMVTLVTNRKTEKTISVESDFVRVRIEFPDEANARTLKEKLRFNGRFLVYELRPLGRFEQ